MNELRTNHEDTKNKPSFLRALVVHLRPEAVREVSGRLVRGTWRARSSNESARTCEERAHSSHGNAHSSDNQIHPSHGEARLSDEHACLSDGNARLSHERTRSSDKKARSSHVCVRSSYVRARSSLVCPRSSHVRARGHNFSAPVFGGGRFFSGPRGATSVSEMHQMLHPGVFS